MIIGITGKKGSGKDTIADYLVENYGFTKIAFADALKDATCALFGITHKQLEEFKNDPNCRIRLLDETTDHIELTMRVFLQRIGTEVGRNILGQDIWVNIVANKIKNQYNNFVVSDCRFPNEVEMVIDGVEPAHHSGNKIIQIEKKYADPDSDDHISEEVSEFYNEKIINNHTSKLWLYGDVDNVMKIWGFTKV